MATSEKRKAPVRLSTAYHEAGHAVTAWQDGFMLLGSTVESSEGTLGSVDYYVGRFGAIRPGPVVSSDAKARRRRLIRFALAGFRAESIFLSRVPNDHIDGALEDMAKAVKLAQDLADTPEDVAAELDRQTLIVRKRLYRDRARVVALANALREQRTLSGTETERVIEAAVPQEER